MVSLCRVVNLWQQWKKLLSILVQDKSCLISPHPRSSSSLPRPRRRMAGTRPGLKGYPGISTIVYDFFYKYSNGKLLTGNSKVFSWVKFKWKNLNKENQISILNCVFANVLHSNLFRIRIQTTDFNTLRYHLLIFWTLLRWRTDSDIVYGERRFLPDCFLSLFMSLVSTFRCRCNENFVSYRYRIYFVE